MKRLILFSLLLSLSACATVTPYQPADAKGFGYAEQRLESNRYRISFQGSGATPAASVENFALLRAAEMTLFNGYDWFAVASRRTGATADAPRDPSVSVGIGTGSYGRSGGFSVGLGQTVSGGGAAQESVIEVLMFKGERPADRQDAFDARELKANLEAGAR